MITYSTNWMGPISNQWYIDRGLTRTVTKVLDHDSTVTERKKGDSITIEEITEYYSAGRIDCSGDKLGPYGSEIFLPPMKSEDWNTFSDWLDTFVTPTMWTLEKLTKQYELEGNSKIRWYND